MEGTEEEYEQYLQEKGESMIDLGITTQLTNRIYSHSEQPDQVKTYMEDLYSRLKFWAFVIAFNVLGGLFLIKSVR